jgi:hypothetical protein
VGIQPLSPAHKQEENGLPSRRSEAHKGSPLVVKLNHTPEPCLCKLKVEMAFCPPQGTRGTHNHFGDTNTPGLWRLLSWAVTLESLGQEET